MVNLIEERVDVAIRVTQPEDSSLIARKIAPVRLVLVAAPSYLERNGIPASPNELSEHNCLIDSNFNLRNRWPFKVEDRVVQVNVSGSARSNSVLTITALALDGIGIAIIPRPLALPHLLDGRLREISCGTVDIPWSVYAVTVRRRLLPRRAVAFIDHLRRFLPDAFNGTEERPAE